MFLARCRVRDGHARRLITMKETTLVSTMVGMENSSTLTPTELKRKISVPFGYPWRTNSQWGRQLSKFPAKKFSGSRHRKKRGEAYTVPEETMSTDGSGPAQLVGLPSQLHQVSCRFRVLICAKVRPNATSYNEVGKNLNKREVENAKHY